MGVDETCEREVLDSWECKGNIMRKSTIIKYNKPSGKKKAKKIEGVGIEGTTQTN